MQHAQQLTDTDVKPVGVVRGELLAAACLDCVNPWGDLDQADALEVGRVGRHEFCSRDVLDGATAGAFHGDVGLRGGLRNGGGRCEGELGLDRVSSKNRYRQCTSRADARS